MSHIQSCVGARGRLLWTIAAAVALAGCGDTSAVGPRNGDNGQVLVGTLAATDGRTGVVRMTTPVSRSVSRPAGLSMAMAQAVSQDLTGTLSLSDGTTVTLTGTWDAATGALSISGGGFSLVATIVAGQASGNFTGPGISGVFSLRVGDTPGELAVYCGTFTGRQPEELPQGGMGTSPSNGTWNLVVGTSTVVAIGIGGQEDQSFIIGGMRSGNDVTVSIPGGSAAGTLSGSASEFVDGTYATPTGEQGTFQGSKAACSATTETATIAALTINAPGLLPGDGRLNGDSTLVFVTARDAQGHFVAAPDLTWTFTAPLRTNTQVTARGQKWVVAYDLTPYNTPPSPATTTVTVTSKNNSAVSVTANVVIHY